MSTPPALLPEHNHNHCIDSALEQAQQLCKQRKQKLTPVRLLVLQLIWASHKPLGAYELLPALKEAGFNSAPPTVYRALEFLQQQGLVHRITSLNAFVGCPHPSEPHDVFFLICKHCGVAVEGSDQVASQLVEQEGRRLGFVHENYNIEILGSCPNCQ